ncbi:response regulator [Paenibacillus gorillae]|uniref:response regulator n=1 Tax=Paenibacillus gorillae TaxID=1243662 RepID=UPI0005AB5C53|nr:response regulator [Paenibacillus gorillae]
MRKMLIVDDEKNIRLGLKMMIEREFPDFYAIRMAVHGQDALAQYEGERADIVITDIRMPIMDGLELIRRLMNEPEKGQEPPIFIILSGYDDFAYARAAIEYQVKNYLLKPIRREELFEALRKSETTLQAQAELAERVAVSDTFREQLQINRLKEWFAQEGDVAIEKADEFAASAGFDTFSRPFTVAVLNDKSESSGSMSKEQFKQMAENLLKPMDGVLDASFLDQGNRLVLIGSPTSQFVELYKQICGNERVHVGISAEGEQAGDLYRCYRQASEALQYSFLYSSCRLLRHEDIAGEARAYPAAPIEEVRKLGNMLGTDREREMLELLKQIFHIEELPRVDIQFLKLAGKMINEQVLDEIFRIYGDGSIEVLKLYRRVGSMDNFHTFHDYYRSLELLLSSVNEYVRGIRSAYSEHSEINAAIAYIEEFYYKPLNMAVVSNHVGLNYSYFSEAFKAHTGESFVLFLKKVRIRKGKELLLEDNRKMQDIGSAVGFENSKQFSRVFKELEGVSPQEYKIKLRTDAQQSSGEGTE